MAGTTVFTLIELLPALGAAKLRAWTIRCASNLHRIGLAGLMHMSDNNSCITYVEGYSDKMAEGWGSLQRGHLERWVVSAQTRPIMADLHCD